MTSEPSYQSTKNYWFWGLRGEHTVDVREVCASKDPVQMQVQDTFADGWLQGLTLGIYYTRTAKVWCE